MSTYAKFGTMVVSLIVLTGMVAGLVGFRNPQTNDKCYQVNLMRVANQYSEVFRDISREARNIKNQQGDWKTDLAVSLGQLKQVNRQARQMNPRDSGLGDFQDVFLQITREFEQGVNSIQSGLKHNDARLIRQGMKHIKRGTAKMDALTEKLQAFK